MNAVALTLRAFEQRCKGKLSQPQHDVGYITPVRLEAELIKSSFADYCEKCGSASKRGCEAFTHLTHILVAHL